MLPRRYFIVLATFLLSVLLYVDRACISTAKGDIIETLSKTDARWLDSAWADTSWGWIMAAFAFGYALLQTPCGALADRMGSRGLLTSVVVLWSVFTGLTAACWNLTSLLIVRFLFGAGEAGAFPGMAKVVYSWIPVKERGLVKGINFSGSRIGAAVTMPMLPWLITKLGWHQAFLLLMVIGFCWATFWFLWFRDEPADKKHLSREELEYILANRQQSATDHEKPKPLPFFSLMKSGNLWLIMGQYFASNFTFYFTLVWLFPYLKKTYHLSLQDTGWYLMAPFVAGAIGNVFSGWLVDVIFKSGHVALSRRLPAIIGFSFAVIGLIMGVGQETALGAILWLSLAVFGADMTLSPSWSFCIDIGGKHAGAVSGTMNMAGNLGSAIVAIAFPLLVNQCGAPTFFYVGAALNVLAIFCWIGARPDRKIEAAS